MRTGLHRSLERHCWTWALPLLLAWCLAVQASADVVTNFRLWPAPDHTRVVLDLDRPVAGDVFTLSNPSRVVIDLPDTALAAEPKTLDLSDSGVREIRSARRQDGTLRIVLDLAEAMTPNDFQLEPNQQYGHRLVVDLERQQQTSPTVEAAHEVRRAETGGQRDIVIAIDAGHGGEDPGAVGVRGTYEKHIVLAIARELEDIVADTRGYSPFMVRTGDYYIPLVQRRQLAREANADFFVSVHADAFTNAQPRGASVYALSNSGSTSTMAAYLADSENRADAVGGVGGVNLQSYDNLVREVLVDLTMSHALREGLAVGDTVLGSLGQAIRLHRRQVEQAGFAVLKSDIPSILVESGFMSNPDDEANLGSPGYRRRIATAIFGGIQSYFSEVPPEGSWVYQQRRRAQRTAEYQVRTGDTLSGIATRHGTTVQQLRTLNDMQGDMIQVGQTLRVPHG